MTNKTLKKAAIAFAVVVTFLSWNADSIKAQDTDKEPRFEVFGGFSTKRVKNELPETTTNLSGDFEKEHTFLNGFDSAVSVAIAKNISIAGEVSGHFKRGQTSFSVPCGTVGCVPPTFNGRLSLSDFDFLAGPEFKIPNKSRVKPFVHALAGAEYTRSRASNTTAGSTFDISDSKTSFSFSLGGGIDYDVSKKFAVRFIQADYNAAFPKDDLGDRKRENNLELSFGAVFKF